MVDELPTAKERAVAIIRGMADDSSFEDILRELVFARSVERGLADAEAGRTISSDEMARRIEGWADRRSASNLVEQQAAELGDSDPQEIELAWQREIRARVEALDAGEVETVPWSEVRARLWEGLDEDSKD